MKTLLEKAYGNYALAVRLITFTREKIRLQGRIRSLEQTVRRQERFLDRQREDILAKEELIRELRAQSYVLPESAGLLIETARYLFEHQQHCRYGGLRPMEVRGWIMEYIAWRNEQRQEGQ
jgi:hypothetical protein